MRPPLLLALWASAALAVSASAHARIASGREEVDDARARARAVERDLDRLAVLRARHQGVAPGRRPSDDLITRVQRALSAAGLPLTACSGVQPRADATIGVVRVQSMQVRLDNLAPAELGAWLAAWRAGEAGWQVSEMQMTHRPGAPAAGLAPTNRYDVILALSAQFVEGTP